ncbi:PREDICTED: uncharacterized protein LOC104773568 isoform X1 [Camelina sativa]|uniref:Uncharacterized protein LOC104773568 isoform X1 n=1 Tax=Camelina sativa TaxID=90675 RepID=A0ABM0Y6Z3_CAMSA|nr:PREDICTED: uncharacterized protein LOC104773568 isoform X1 [Camelina sativa]
MTYGTPCGIWGDLRYGRGKLRDSTEQKKRLRRPPIPKDMLAASVESETQPEKDLSGATTTIPTTSSSSMQTAAAPPIKLEDVIPPRAAVSSFKDKKKNLFKKKTKKNKKKLAKAKAN